MACFGENLRKERELRGVSLREVADATKISVRFLQALEQDRVDVLPGGLFPKAFVRQYARFLGLDAERVVTDFVCAHGPGLSERVTASASAEPPRRGALLALLAGAGVVGLIAAGMLKGGPPPSAVPAAARAPEPAPVPEAQRPPDRVYPPPAAEAERPDPDALVLTLQAKGNCWVSLRVDGQNVMNRVLTEGESQTVQARAEIVLSVGNAGGLSFTVNDRAGVSLGRAGEVRRNIVITRDSLPSLVEAAPKSRVSDRL